MPPRTLNAPVGVWFSCLTQTSQPVRAGQQRPGILRGRRHRRVHQRGGILEGGEVEHGSALRCRDSHRASVERIVWGQRRHCLADKNVGPELGGAQPGSATSPSSRRRGRRHRRPATCSPASGCRPIADLAWKLGLNVSTVTQAYREAARRHLVWGEVGRGTYVLAASREAALLGRKAVVPNGAALDDRPVDQCPGGRPGQHRPRRPPRPRSPPRGGIHAALAYHSPALLRPGGIAGAAPGPHAGCISGRPMPRPAPGAQAALTAWRRQALLPPSIWCCPQQPGLPRPQGGGALAAPCRCTASPWTARACCPRHWTAPSAPPAPGSWRWCRTCRTRTAR